jgi:hypothetical protein
MRWLSFSYLQTSALMEQIERSEHAHLLLGLYDLSETPLADDPTPRAQMQFFMGAATDQLFDLMGRALALDHAQRTFSAYFRPSEYFTAEELVRTDEMDFPTDDEKIIMERTFNAVFGQGAWNLLNDEETFQAFDRLNPI